MSLGPPFDESGERLQLGAGAATVVGLLAAVAISLLASDRTLGESFSLRLLVRQPGNLHTGAHVNMAGEQIGEVVAIRGSGWLQPYGRRGLPPAPLSARDGDEQRPWVEIDVRILRRYQPYIYRNSIFFSSTPNVLTEAALEVGPPMGGAAPGPQVEHGETLRGVDPPDIDRLVQKVHDSLVIILAVSRDLSPEWAAFRTAVARLFATARDVAGAEQVARIAVQGQRAWRAGRKLLDALEQAQAAPRVSALHDELSRTVTDLRPQLRALGGQLDALDESVRGITAAIGPEQRQDLEEGVRHFRQVIASAERISDDLAWLLGHLDRGGGTIGGFAHDIQIFDELKEITRLLKHETLRVLIKGKDDKGQRQVR